MPSNDHYVALSPLCSLKQPRCFPLLHVQGAGAAHSSLVMPRASVFQVEPILLQWNKVGCAYKTGARLELVPASRLLLPVQYQSSL